MAKTADAKPKKNPKRNGWAGIVIVLILYIGIHILSRTEGARSWVADKISTGTHLPVELEGCAATPLLGLRLKGLSFSGAQMPDVRIDFNWFSFFSKAIPLIRQLDIRGLDVEFKRVSDSGTWEPLVLHGLGSRLGIVLGLNPAQMGTDNSLPKFPAHEISEKTLFQLSRAKMVWSDEQGHELAYISNADLSVEPGSFIDRKVVQTIFTCGHIKLASGKLLRDFRMETFQFGDSGLVAVLGMADCDGEYDEFASRTLWQDLNLRLNALSER